MVTRSLSISSVVIVLILFSTTRSRLHNADIIYLFVISTVCLHVLTTLPLKFIGVALASGCTMYRSQCWS